MTASSTDALTDHEMDGLWQKVAGKAPRPRKTWIALSILAGVVLVGSWGREPLPLIAVAGAALMVITGVLTPRLVVRALNWNILAIIAGSVGLETIVVESGLGPTSPANPGSAGGSTALVILLIAVVTTLLTNHINTAAAAAC